MAPKAPPPLLRSGGQPGQVRGLHGTGQFARSQPATGGASGRVVVRWKPIWLFRPAGIENPPPVSAFVGKTAKIGDNHGSRSTPASLWHFLPFPGPPRGSPVHRPKIEQALQQLSDGQRSALPAQAPRPDHLPGRRRSSAPYLPAHPALAAHASLVRHLPNLFALTYCPAGGMDRAARRPARGRQPASTHSRWTRRAQHAAACTAPTQQGLPRPSMASGASRNIGDPRMRRCRRILLRRLQALARKAPERNRQCGERTPGRNLKKHRTLRTQRHTSTHACFQSESPGSPAILRGGVESRAALHLSPRR